MRVTTKAVYDLESGELLEWEGYDYQGPVDELKYDSAKSAAQQQQARDNKLQKQSFDYQKSLMDAVKNNLQQYLTGNVGFDPAQLAALQTQFLGSNAQSFNQARSGVVSALAARGAGGGQQPVGGDYVRGLSGLYGAEANAQSGGLTGIGLQNLAQALSNKFNTAQIFSGNAATLNSPISTFGAGASNALNQYVQLSQAPTFWNSFAPALGGSLGKSIGSGVGSSIFPGASPAPTPCWIAGTLWGPDDPKTLLLREWLVTEYSRTTIGTIVVGTYRTIGKPVAWLCQKSSTLRKLIRPLFDAGLKRACAGPWSSWPNPFEVKDGVMYIP